MADGRGGYQRPRKPAPASGPGKMSRRTDGAQPIRTLSDAAYGEQQTFHDIQAAAPMAPGGGAPTGGEAPMQGADLSQVVPFGAPSQRGEEPVTAGAASGPGPGPGAAGMGRSADDPGVQFLRDMLPTLSLASELPTSSVQYRQFVRRLRGSV